MSNEKLYDDSMPSPQAGDFRYAIVAARFNAFIVDKLLEGAKETLITAGASAKQIAVYRVPGAFEIPLACQKLALTGKFDAIIALGCIIRGDTPHFDYVCAESARGIAEVSLKHNLPVIYGILTTDDTAQAEARINTAAGNNKGVDAAKSAMEVLALYAALDETQ
jgi:6,7-dimethyl-8-ribityllumazine synthase